MLGQEMAPGQSELANLQKAGFTDKETEAWKVETQTSLLKAGFNDKEVKEYFGVKEPDDTKIKENFASNTTKNLTEVSASGETKTKEAKNFIEALEAGFDMSVTGLIKSGEMPDTVLPEAAPMYMRIASQLGTIGGDLPAMIGGAVAGGLGGGALGSTVPVVGTGIGTFVGANAGANALPEAIRTTLMESYEKGEVEDFADFWSRASKVFIQTTKAGIVGAAGGIAGKVAGSVAKVAGPVVKTTAQMTSEVATLATVGAGLEGRVPEPSEFLDAAILMGGLGGSVYIGSKGIGKIRNIYSKTGVTPGDLTVLAEQDPHVKQQMLASNVEVPTGLKNISVEAQLIPKPKAPEVFEVTKSLGKKVVEPSEASTKILSKIRDVGEKVDAPKEALTFNKFYTNFVDKLDPINQITKILEKESGDNFTADKNPYILSRMAVDYKAKAKHFFEKGTLNGETLETNGRGLTEILKSVDDIDQLEAYMVSKRVVEKEGQGIKTGFDLDAANEVSKTGRAKYEAAAKEVTEFSNRTLDYVSESGVLSSDSLKKIKEMNKEYVPFKRIFEQAEKDSGKGKGKAGSLKEMTGSERDIQSPIQTIVENTVELLRMAEVNRPKAELVIAALKNPEQTLIEKVTPKVKGVDVTDQVNRSLEKQGLEPSEDPITAFVRLQKDLAPDEFSVYIDGKREVYKADPVLAEALQKLDGDRTSMNMAFKLMNAITTVKRVAITFTPDFQIRNLMRDKVTASVFSESGKVKFTDVISAMGSLIKKDDTYYAWLKSGGANGAFLDLTTNYIAKDIYGLQKETSFMNSVRNLAEKPIELMRIGSELAEQSLRLAEFAKIQKKAGVMTRESLAKGGFASREITVDFQRMGAKMSALNSITAFQNVSIQGLDRAARAFAENPTGFMQRGATYITAPSILLWYVNKDDERYKELPRWEKDLFWHITTDDWQKASPEEIGGLPEYLVRMGRDGSTEINRGTVYRIPKPHELGVIFGSLPERMLEAFFTDNPNSFKDFEETLGEMITPALIPDAVAPAIEQYFNKSFFTGRDIVPQHVAGLIGEYQYTEYTSEPAKLIGKMVRPFTGDASSMGSPMVIDNYIRSWGGTLGQYAVSVASDALVAAGASDAKVKPSKTLSDIPFIKAFVTRYPSANANSIQDFYDNFEKNERVRKTLSYLEKNDSPDSMASYEKELGRAEDLGLIADLRPVKAALSEHNQAIRLIVANPEITPDEKRQLIDGLYYGMIETAKQGNRLLKEIDEANKNEGK